jgi:hypothetical protein
MQTQRRGGIKIQTIRSLGAKGMGDQTQPLPRERDPVPVVEKAGWALRPVCTNMENFTPPGLDSRTVKLYLLSYPNCPSLVGTAF